MDQGKTFFIETYGCEMNKSDSVDIALSLEDHGYIECNSASDADVVVINTCFVRKHAEQRIYGRLGYYRGLKNRTEKSPVIVLTGCMAQLLGEEVRALFPEIDIVCGTSHGLHIHYYLQERDRTGEPIVLTDQNGYEFSSFGGRRAQRHHAWVTIIKGCSNFCSYCIVPYVRGPELSKHSETVLQEVEALVAQGVTEVTLLGQNVNAYGKDSGDMSFMDLLERLDRVEGLRWIRFLTSHPKDFNGSVIRRIAGCEKVCRHFHLPLQSGSDRILEIMNRGYTVRHYMDIVEALHRWVSDFTITTDIIVGFPSETESDFQQTLSIYKEVGFDEAFTYRYSSRPYISAERLPGKVDQATAQWRLEQIISLVTKISLERNRREVGREVQALVEGRSRKNPTECLAKTEQGRMVVMRTAKKPGHYVRVRINGLSGRTLRGEEVPEECIVHG
jgi:tRNA-2-methylthio-N6-dimethylallyladenosine synthase